MSGLKPKHIVGILVVFICLIIWYYEVLGFFQILTLLFGLWFWFIFDPGKSKSKKKPNLSTARADHFRFYLLVLAAKMIKSDGEISQEQTHFVRARFLKMFGAAATQQTFQKFKSFSSIKISLGRLTQQLRKHLSKNQRTQLIIFLIQIAQSDNPLNDRERSFIKRIGKELFLEKEIIQYLLSNHQKVNFDEKPKRNKLAGAYEILKTSPASTEREIKKAYRNLVKIFHPDKLSDLDKEVQKQATNRFNQIQLAYETIKRERGFN